MPSVPKPIHNRRTQRRRNLTRITANVRKEVLERSERACERCRRTQAYAFEMAHLDNASQGGKGGDPANIVLLCGPKVNTGTCHHWADSTTEGREWKKTKKAELIDYYNLKGGWK